MSFPNLLFLLFFSGSLLANGKIVETGSREWRELNLSDLAKNLHRTYSKAGFAEFEQLMQPMSDVAELKHRQRIFRKLLDETTFQQLDALSKKFSEDSETMLLNINTLSEAELGFFPLQKPSFKFQLLLNTATLAGFVQYALFSWKNLKNGLTMGVDKGALERNWISWNVFIERIGLLIGGYYTAQAQAGVYQKIQLADKQVLIAGKMFELGQQLRESVKDSPVLSRSPFGERMNKLWNAIENIPPLKSIVESAQSRYLNQDSTWRYLQMLGSVDTYDGIKNAPVAIAELIRVFAELDAYLSVARLYREQKSEFVFASYLEPSEPQFSFIGLGNPLITNATRNDFQLDAKTGARHWVITGPHACGKTTAMRSIAYAIILGQSLTLVPASKAELTPMTSIKTYFNIGDNILEGKSSFVAEHLRMQELIDYSKNIDSKGRVLMLVDEPYAKTIQVVGEPLVAEFLKSISNTQKLSVILATHFEQPAQLESETQGKIINHQPEINDELKPTFKIIPGAAMWWFKDAEKRTEFIKRTIFGEI